VKKAATLFLVLLVGFFFRSNGQAQTQLFSLVSPDSSGVKFRNVIQDDTVINILEYLYYYNGAGVAIGDVNNDGLPDLYFTSNRFQCKLYLNKGNLKFEDVTKQAGVGGIGGGIITGVVMVDINNDGWMDMYLCRSASADPEMRRNILYVNNKDGTFSNQAKEYGIDDDGFGTCGYFNDLDGDGDLDLFVVNHPYNFVETDGIHLTYNKSNVLVAAKDTSLRGESSRYYENVNGKFIDKTYSAGLRTRSFGLSALLQDFNNDGKTDIYLANDFLEPDYLFINKGGGKFENQFDAHFKHGAYFSMGTDYADLNNDGHSDLIVTDMLPTDNRRRKQLMRPSNYDQFNKQVKYGFGYQYLKNVVQINNGNSTYSDMSYYTGMAFTDWSWAVLIQDFDNDGLKDVYIANGMPRDIHDLDYVRFKMDSIKKALVKSKNSEDILKLLSAIPTVRIQKHYYKNYGNLQFRKENKDAGLEQFAWSFGAAYGDLDLDGDLEIVVNNTNDYAFIYKNNSIETGRGNALRFQVNGPPANINGIGLKIQVSTPDGVTTTTVVNPMKGYISSHDKNQIIGIGKNLEAKVAVTWPDGKTQTFRKVAPGQSIRLNYAEAIATDQKIEPVQPVFEDVTSSIKLRHLHKENEYIDFKLEPLLPHRCSQFGPCLGVGDLNGDGLDDLFIGGAKDIAAHIYFQKPDSTFVVSVQPAFEADKKFEDGAVALLDIDKDGDQDLLVTTCGNEYPNQPSRYPIRIYINDGKGNFKAGKFSGKYFTSANSIAVSDLDRDGNPEVFIGGRVVPGHYGRIPKSYLFTVRADSLEEIRSCPALSTIGMVTSATFGDFNGDGWFDLAIAGEWMPVSIFYNEKGVLRPDSKNMANSHGWWNKLVAADVDKDGKTDLVAGNMGLNSRYRGSKERPISMVVSDFDNNGSTDCMISLFIRDKSYPIGLRDNVLDQMPYLRKKFLRYSSYANATIEDIFTPQQLKTAAHFSATNLVSSVFRNLGQENFEELYLPGEAQLFPINAIEVQDFNKDGIPDILVAGNDYSSEVETGRNDAGIGLYLIGLGKGQFRTMAPVASGLFIPGDVKSMVPMTISNKIHYVFGKNQDYVQVVKPKQ
jgi:enediyne biosynthesis protein E4